MGSCKECLRDHEVFRFQPFDRIIENIRGRGQVKLVKMVLVACQQAVDGRERKLISPLVKPFLDEISDGSVLESQESVQEVEGAIPGQREPIDSGFRIGLNFHKVGGLTGREEGIHRIDCFERVGKADLVPSGIMQGNQAGPVVSRSLFGFLGSRPTPSQIGGPRGVHHERRRVAPQEYGEVVGVDVQEAVNAAFLPSRPSNLELVLANGS